MLETELPAVLAAASALSADVLAPVAAVCAALAALWMLARVVDRPLGMFPSVVEMASTLLLMPVIVELYPRMVSTLVLIAVTAGAIELTLVLMLVIVELHPRMVFTLVLMALRVVVRPCRSPKVPTT